METARYLKSAINHLPTQQSFTFTPIINEKMVEDALQYYWSPREVKYDPSSMGASFREGPEGLRYSLVLDLSFDVSDQFQEYAEQKRAEIENLIKKRLNHKNVEDIARNIGYNIYYQGIKDNHWGDPRYSSKIMQLIEWIPEIRKSKEVGPNANEIADWLENYMNGAIAARTTADRLIEETVDSYMKKRGLDKSL